MDTSEDEDEVEAELEAVEVKVEDEDEGGGRAEDDGVGGPVDMLPTKVEDEAVNDPPIKEKPPERAKTPAPLTTKLKL